MRGPFPWREVLSEAALLGAFMAVACAFGVALDHPASSAIRVVPDPFARRAIFGLAMGATAIAIVYSPAGKRSGAHINPAVTLAFLALGKVRGRQAAPYVAAQIAGAAAGVLAARAALGAALADPAVHYVTTRPGPWGIPTALVAELLLSFALMSAVLVVSASRHAAWTGVCAGALVFLFITFEAPVSGMSVNPGRSFGSAVVAGEWDALWIYFVAPPSGMLAAAALFRRRATRACAKLHHADDVPCIFCGQLLPEPRSTSRAA